MTGRRRLAGILLATVLATMPSLSTAFAEDGVPAGEVRLTGSQIKLIELATEPAKPGAVSPELVLNGEVIPDQGRVVDILPRAAGIVREVPRQLGDTVRDGDILAVIESSAIAEAEASYLTARSKSALTQAQAAREADLRRKRITSEQDYQIARQAAEQAAVELRAAERKLALLGLDPTTAGRGPAGVPVRVAVKAPFDGTLIERRVAVGDQVTEATPLFRLANLDRVWVIASVFSKDVAKVATGEAATVALEGYADRRFEGKVTWISDVVDEKTRTLKIRVELENRDRLLRPGSFARVTITPGTDTSVLTIPATAVQRQKDQAFVFVDGGSGTFRKREVTLGSRRRDRVEVTRGLEAGEKVVTQGSFALRSELEKSSFAGSD
ncbi:MAG: efflux RND transporter periplasmic adaptor subunit [Alphaproteobacteria bacterium]|nr:efflux RND transporter periplasmic adaptor subunit [Alphaproteobacteria bacterium]